MGTARPLHKVDRTVDWEARCRTLEQRDQERARELAKAQTAVRTAQRVADEQRRLRVEAEHNAQRFHAMLLTERIRKLP